MKARELAPDQLREGSRFETTDARGAQRPRSYLFKITERLLGKRGHAEKVPEREVALKMK